VKQRVSLITLGVSDLERARAFYEALGWRTGAAPGDDVAFFQAGDMVLALWDRARLAEDSCVEDSPGWGGVTLALNFGSPAEVDAAIEEARARWRDDRPRAGRDLLGRLQLRLPRPRRAPLGDRPQPALAGHRGRRRQARLSPCSETGQATSPARSL
jgi:catechol 2,3-dioxygenase-like lactoylglutathione lyase family enzyme